MLTYIHNGQIAPKTWPRPRWDTPTPTTGAQLWFEAVGGRPHAANTGPPEAELLTEIGVLFKGSGAARPRARLAGQVDDCGSNPGAAGSRKRSIRGAAGPRESMFDRLASTCLRSTIAPSTVFNSSLRGHEQITSMFDNVHYTYYEHDLTYLRSPGYSCRAADWSWTWFMW